MRRLGLAWLCLLSCAAAQEAPTWPVRREVYFKKLIGPQALLETLPGATFDFVRGFPAEWPRTTQGAAIRLASQYGQFLVGETIELGVSAIHNEDPRYYRMPELGFRQRLRHALVSTVVVRNNAGSPTIAAGRLADVYGSWAIATTWNPPSQHNLVSVAKYGSLGLSIKAAGNLFREFWPDVKQRMKK